MTEEQLQAQLFKWYHNNFCTIKSTPQHIIFSVPNGAHVSTRQAMTLKATGLIAGVSDMIIIQPNKVLFIEVKIEKGNQSPEQIKFQQKIEALGFEYHVARSLEEFQKIVKI